MLMEEKVGGGGFEIGKGVLGGFKILQVSRTIGTNRSTFYESHSLFIYTYTCVAGEGGGSRIGKFQN